LGAAEPTRAIRPDSSVHARTDGRTLDACPRDHLDNWHGSCFNIVRASRGTSCLTGLFVIRGCASPRSR
jgi:hypothetical protein